MRRQKIDPTARIRVSDETNRFADATLENAYEQVLPAGLARARSLWVPGEPAQLGWREA